MKLGRRKFLKTAALASSISVLSCQRSAVDQNQPSSLSKLPETATDSWDSIRANFNLDPDYIHLAALLLASHPKPVREAIEKHRNSLNENPAEYMLNNFSSLPAKVRQSAAEYMEVQPNEIALTDSTTMGTALLINGLKIREDQEMLTADYDYYSTHRSIEFKALRSGASYRKISIYDDIHQVSEDEIIDKIFKEIHAKTRLLTGTWVHSATGLKIPVKKIAVRLADINSNRSEEDRVIFFIDGVHGFGVENQSVADLGCDFFSAGTHKWMFAPRGTGILWGHRRVHGSVSPTIPTFTGGAGWGGQMTPGGFKPFEHQWSVVKAFQFHQDIGKDRVKNHIHTLARQLKEGLAEMDHITLYTPMEENLSSGIVCFSVKEMGPRTVDNRLAQKNIIASTTPYTPSYARLTPAIYNTKEEMKIVLKAVADLA